MQCKQHAVKLGDCDGFVPWWPGDDEGCVVGPQPGDYYGGFVPQDIVHRLAKFSGYKQSAFKDVYFTPKVAWFLSQFDPQRFVEELKNGIISHLWMKIIFTCFCCNQKSNFVWWYTRNETGEFSNSNMPAMDERKILGLVGQNALNRARTQFVVSCFLVFAAAVVVNRYLQNYKPTFLALIVWTSFLDTLLLFLETFSGV